VRSYHPDDNSSSGTTLRWYLISLFKARYSLDGHNVDVVPDVVGHGIRLSQELLLNVLDATDVGCETKSA
jgi:hypothetical protein